MLTTFATSTISHFNEYCLVNSAITKCQRPQLFKVWITIKKLCTEKITIQLVA